MGRVGAILLDLALVVLFAIIGRLSHNSGLETDALMRTALPFVAGLLLAWVGIALRRREGLTLPEGVMVWAMTLVMGMAFRLLIGDTAQVAFIIVAAVTLALFLIGWRAIRHVVVSRRPGAPEAPKVKDPKRSGNPAKRAGA